MKELSVVEVWIAGWDTGISQGSPERRLPIGFAGIVGSVGSVGIQDE